MLPVHERGTAYHLTFEHLHHHSTRLRNIWNPTSFNCLSPASRACDYVYIDYVRRSRSSSCRLLRPINCQTYITLHYMHARYKICRSLTLNLRCVCYAVHTCKTCRKSHTKYTMKTFAHRKWRRAALHGKSSELCCLVSVCVSVCLSVCLSVYEYVWVLLTSCHASVEQPH